MKTVQVTTKLERDQGPALRTASRPAWWRSPAVLLVIATLMVAGIIAAESLAALAIVLLEGSIAAAVLAAAALAGGWLVPLLGLRDRPGRDRFLLGAGLGIGLLSLVVLGLGSAGWLTRPVAIALILALMIAAWFRLWLDLSELFQRIGLLSPVAKGGSRGVSDGREKGDESNLLLDKFHWFWLLVCPFLAITLLAATLPPGVLWDEEGFGYDVLEYHLAVPKAFFTAGRILFLPNNVYSNFPLNGEMFSLLMMTLRGDPIEAACMATIVNVVLAALFVAMAWWAGRTFSPRCGVMAGVLAATAPWLGYLAGIVFVEPGMLALGMGSLAAVLQVRRDERHAKQWFLAAGLLAGLACGYKYTAIPLIAMPLAVMPLFANLPWSGRIRGTLLFSLAVAITFSPWMIRNLVHTRNPVFPLAYSVFGAKSGTWDAELNERWQHGHSRELALPMADKPVPWMVLKRTLLDYRLGTIGVILAVICGLRRRDRWTAAMVILLLWQGVVWFTATHLFARFAVVMLLPVLVLAARTMEGVQHPAAFRLIYAVLLLSTAGNLYHLGSLYYDHTRFGPAGEPLNAFGRTDLFASGDVPGLDYLKVINALGDRARVMLVGEARTFYVRAPCEYAVVFNRHPLSEAVRQLPDAKAVLRLLAKRGTTHLLVHWAEIDRLRRTYGFDPRIDADLFARLEAAGLKKMGSFSISRDRPAYATLYEVPGHE